MSETIVSQYTVQILQDTMLLEAAPEKTSAESSV